MSAPTGSARVRDDGLSTTTLANGIGSVASGVWVRVGGRDEPAELAGASHFLEHLLFKGTEARTARSIAEDVDAVGGEMNAHTGREYTAFYTRLPDTAWRLGIEILGDILAAPAFRPVEVEAERRVILEEILLSLDTPDDLVHVKLAESLFPDHPLGREVLGSPDTVEHLGREDIRGFFAGRYRPANLVVVAAGNIDHDAFTGAVDGALGSAAGGDAPVRSAPSPATEPRSVIERSTEQVHLALGWRALPAGHEDRYALAVANQALGGGTSSRLFQEVREERGLAYTVFSHVSSYTDAGALTLYAGTGPDRVGELTEVVDVEVERVATEGLSERELAVAKGYLEGSAVLGLEDSAGRMARVGRALMTEDEVVAVDTHLERLRAVTSEDVRRVAEQVLGGPRTLAAVGPVRDDLFA